MIYVRKVHKTEEFIRPLYRISYQEVVIDGRPKMRKDANQRAYQFKLRPAMLQLRAGRTEADERLAVATQAATARRMIECRGRNDPKELPPDKQRQSDVLIQTELMALADVNLLLGDPLPDDYRAIWIGSQLAEQKLPRSVIRYLDQRGVLGEEETRQRGKLAQLRRNAERASYLSASCELKKAVDRFHRAPKCAIADGHYYGTPPVSLAQLRDTESTLLTTINNKHTV